MMTATATASSVAVAPVRPPPSAVVLAVLVAALTTTRTIAASIAASAAAAAAVAATMAASTASVTSLRMSKRRARRVTASLNQTAPAPGRTPSPFSDDALPPVRTCRLCSGGGSRPCDVCGGNGALAPGGVHPKNNVRLASLVGSQWTSVEAIPGKDGRRWRHFVCCGKRVVDGAVAGAGPSGQVVEGELPIDGDGEEEDADELVALATALRDEPAGGGGKRSTVKPHRTTLAVLTSTCGPEANRICLEVPVRQLRSRRHWQSGWTTLVDIERGQVPADCFRCKGRGRVACPRCDGLGCVGL